MNTLVIAPHADDEVFGCGGTLVRRKAEGHRVAWLVVTDISEDSGWPADAVARRSTEILRVAELMAFDRVFRLGLPSTRLDQVPTGDLVARIGQVVSGFAPDEVFVPHPFDVHSDHRVVFEAAAACVKWFRHPSVRRVLAYETVSETEFGLGTGHGFHPNVFVDIAAHLERKLEAMAVYRTETGAFPFPRSVEAVRALAAWRGAAAGFAAAEAFQLLRERG